MDDDLKKKLIYRGYEGRNVEYKSARPWNEDNNEERLEIIRAALAFANAGGGYIIIGYDENNEAISDQRTGIDEKYLSTWDSTNVNKKINSHCRPNLNVDVIKYIDPDENKKYIILDVPAHYKLPHICIKQAQNKKGDLVLKRGAVYYRSKNNSCEEISDPDEFDELFQRCLLNRTEELQKYFTQILRGEVPYSKEREIPSINIFEKMDILKKETERYNPHDRDEGLIYVELFAMPSNTRAPFAVDKVNLALRKASKNYSGWPFIFYLRSGDCTPKSLDDRILAFNNKPFFDRKVFDYWVFFYETGIFYSRYLTFDSIAFKDKIFDPLSASKFIGEVLVGIGKLYNMIEVQLDEELQFGIRYSPTNGVRISSGGRYDLLESPEFEDAQLTYKLIDKLSALLNSPGDTGALIIRNLIQKMRYPGGLGIDYFKKQIEEHLANPKFDY